MPKIVINEIDRTKAGIGEYANFSVLVPGFFDTNAEEKTQGWDDNDVQEFTSQSTFIKRVGKVAMTRDQIPAKCPTFTFITHEGEEPATSYLCSALTPYEFFTTYANRVYKKTAWADVEPTETAHDGYLAVVEDKYDTKGTKIADAGKYSLVDGKNYDATYAYYYVINPGNDGNDAITKNPHNGNQIAYELLGLGYSVLYKKIDPEQANVEDATESTKYKLNNYNFWSIFEDKATYDFRYVVSGYCGESDDNNYKLVNSCLSQLATNRGDCTALIDISESTYSGTAKNNWKQNVVEYINGTVDGQGQPVITSGVGSADKYSALFMPTVSYGMTADPEYGNNTKFPGYFHYLLCASQAFVIYPEWFAVAGYTRGISSTYNITSTGIKLGDAAIQFLEPRYYESTSTDVTKAVNVIAGIKGTYYLWGNRTAHMLGAKSDPVNGDLVASHFLNIRQLCSTIKKQLYVTCRRFTFDPNSDVLWINFCNAISPMLDKMKANQGIEDYKIIKVPTDEKATLKAKIRIVPIEAVEDFYLDLYLEDSIVGTSVEIEESVN